MQENPNELRFGVSVCVALDFWPFILSLHLPGYFSISDYFDFRPLFTLHFTVKSFLISALCFFFDGNGKWAKGYSCHSPNVTGVHFSQLVPFLMAQKRSSLANSVRHFQAQNQI